MQIKGPPHSLSLAKIDEVLGISTTVIVRAGLSDPEPDATAYAPPPLPLHH
jgi:hypothetical protein